MKKKIKFVIACVLVGLFFGSCAMLGERQKCPAYSKVKAVENIASTVDYSKIKQTL